jgi:phosphoribosyl-ATP pyrophosphohydrolase/phosphoribosyl-AMP cyclohydrolase
MTAPFDLDVLDFAKGGGLVTVVTQDASTGAVLMVAFADRAALEQTIATGEMHYHSRRRGLWHKGSTSGNVQVVESLSADCDGDAVLARVRSVGPACHTGAAARAARPSVRPSYTRRLLDDRNLRLKKLGEESTELAVALADGDAQRAVDEAADLVYHVLTALRALDVGIDEVRAVLERRAGLAQEATEPTASPDSRRLRGVP